MSVGVNISRGTIGGMAGRLGGSSIVRGMLARHPAAAVIIAAGYLYMQNRPQTGDWDDPLSDNWSGQVLQFPEDAWFVTGATNVANWPRPRSSRWALAWAARGEGLWWDIVWQVWVRKTRGTSEADRMYNEALDRMTARNLGIPMDRPGRTTGPVGGLGLRPWTSGTRERTGDTAAAPRSEPAITPGSQDSWAGNVSPVIAAARERADPIDRGVPPPVPLRKVEELVIAAPNGTGVPIPAPTVVTGSRRDRDRAYGTIGGLERDLPTAPAETEYVFPVKRSTITTAAPVLPEPSQDVKVHAKGLLSRMLKIALAIADGWSEVDDMLKALAKYARLKGAPEGQTLKDFLYQEHGLTLSQLVKAGQAVIEGRAELTATPAVLLHAAIMAQFSDVVIGILNPSYAKRLGLPISVTRARQMYGIVRRVAKNAYGVDLPGDGLSFSAVERSGVRGQIAEATQEVASIVLGRVLGITTREEAARRMLVLRPLLTK